MANKRDIKRDMRRIAENLADDVYQLAHKAVSDEERASIRAMLDRIASLEAAGVRKVGEARKSAKGKEKLASFFATVRDDFNKDVALIESEIRKLFPGDN